MGRTVVFICGVPYDALFGEPDEETAETAWLSLYQFICEGRPLHVPVVKHIERSLKCRGMENMLIDLISTVFSHKNS